MARFTQCTSESSGLALCASLLLRWCTCVGMSARESHLAISVDGGLPFGTRFLEPVLQHRVADFFQVRGELRCGLDDGHAFLLQLVEIPAVLVLRGFPSARLRVRGGLQ